MNLTQITLSAEDLSIQIIALRALQKITKEALDALTPGRFNYDESKEKYNEDIKHCEALIDSYKRRFKLLTGNEYVYTYKKRYVHE